MFAKIIYFPLLTVVIVIGLLALRRVVSGNLRSDGNRRMFKLLLVAIALAASSLYLMFGVDEPWAPWAAVGVVSVVMLPLLTPVGLIVIAMMIAKLRGKPIRWN